MATAVRIPFYFGCTADVYYMELQLDCDLRSAVSIATALKALAGWDLQQAAYRSLRENDVFDNIFLSSDDIRVVIERDAISEAAPALRTTISIDSLHSRSSSLSFGEEGSLKCGELQTQPTEYRDDVMVVESYKYLVEILGSDIEALSRYIMSLQQGSAIESINGVDNALPFTLRAIVNDANTEDAAFQQATSRYLEFHFWNSIVNVLYTNVTFEQDADSFDNSGVRCSCKSLPVDIPGPIHGSVRENLAKFRPSGQDRREVKWEDILAAETDHFWTQYSARETYDGPFYSNKHLLQSQPLFFRRFMKRWLPDMTYGRAIWFLACQIGLTDAVQNVFDIWPGLLEDGHACRLAIWYSVPQGWSHGNLWERFYGKKWMRSDDDYSSRPPHSLSDVCSPAAALWRRSPVCVEQILVQDIISYICKPNQNPCRQLSEESGVKSWEDSQIRKIVATSLRKSSLQLLVGLTCDEILRLFEVVRSAISASHGVSDRAYAFLLKSFAARLFATVETYYDSTLNMEIALNGDNAKSRRLHRAELPKATADRLTFLEDDFEAMFATAFHICRCQDCHPHSLMREVASWKSVWIQGLFTPKARDRCKETFPESALHDSILENDDACVWDDFDPRALGYCDDEYYVAELGRNRKVRSLEVRKPAELSQVLSLNNKAMAHYSESFGTYYAFRTWWRECWDFPYECEERAFWADYIPDRCDEDNFSSGRGQFGCLTTSGHLNFECNLNYCWYL